MARLQTTLATELKKIANTSSEATAIAGWANAFDLYMATASATIAGSPVPLVPSPTYKAKMSAAMVGMSSGSAAAGKIAAGINAYWQEIKDTNAVAFPSSTLVTKPAGLTGLAGDLQAQFNLNRALTAATGFNAISFIIHDACAGGTVTIPPATGPIL